MDRIEEKIRSFGRTRDIKNEDTDKELKKYMLGLLSDLELDKGTNPLGFCSSNRGYQVKQQIEFSFLYSVYSKIDIYKRKRYLELFKSVEADLRERYDKLLHKKGKDGATPRKKIDWDLYNIYPDRLILLSTAALICFFRKCEVPDTSFDAFPISALAEELKLRFPTILGYFGLTAKTRLVEELKTLNNALQSLDFSYYTSEEEDEEVSVLNQYIEMSASDLFEKIKQQSEQADVSISTERKRNTTLVGLLKKYYMVSFAKEKPLRCECCGENFFLTDYNEPYAEFHHLIPFNIAFGPDHYLNLFALCPNCHRKVHYLNLSDKQIEYKNLSDRNYLQIDFENRLQALKKQKLLRSYHLEYLLADNAISQSVYESIAI